MKYMIEARRLGGWEDGQWEDDDGPLRFDTIEEGNKAINEFIAEFPDADHKAEDYRVVIDFSRFDAYEVHPCVNLGKDDEGNDMYEQCDHDDPDIAVWVVYGHLKTGGPPRRWSVALVSK